MQNNEKNYEGGERKDKEKFLKITFNGKKEFDKGSFIYDTHKKSLKFGPPLFPPIQFWSEFTSLLDVLQWNFLENVNNEIK